MICFEKGEIYTNPGGWLGVHKSRVNRIKRKGTKCTSEGFGLGRPQCGGGVGGNLEYMCCFGDDTRKSKLSSFHFHIPSSRRKKRSESPKSRQYVCIFVNPTDVRTPTTLFSPS